VVRREGDEGKTVKIKEKIRSLTGDHDRSSSGEGDTGRSRERCQSLLRRELYAKGHSG